MKGFYVSLKNISGFQQRTFQWDAAPWDAGDCHNQKKMLKRETPHFLKSFYLRIQTTKPLFGKKKINMASVFSNPALIMERRMPDTPTWEATDKYPFPSPSAMVWWQSLWRKHQRMGGEGIRQLWRQNFCLNLKMWFILSLPSYS